MSETPVEREPKRFDGSMMDIPVRLPAFVWEELANLVDSGTEMSGSARSIFFIAISMQAHVY